MLLFTSLKEQQPDVWPSRRSGPVLGGLFGTGGAVTPAATRGSQRAGMLVLILQRPTEDSCWTAG